jgi:GNAT superfamily N-acetyltransferase
MKKIIIILSLCFIVKTYSLEENFFLNLKIREQISENLCLKKIAKITDADYQAFSGEDDDPVAMLGVYAKELEDVPYDPISNYCLRASIVHPDTKKPITVGLTFCEPPHRLGYICIPHAYRRRGVGKQLIKKIQETNDYIEVSSIHKAMPFYRKLGFIAYNTKTNAELTKDEYSHLQERLLGATMIYRKKDK